MMSGAGFGMGGGLLGGVGMILVWLIPVLLLLWLGRGLFGSAQGSRRRPDARELLESAYARGEISREEFLLKRKDLGAV